MMKTFRNNDEAQKRVPKRTRWIAIAAACILWIMALWLIWGYLGVLGLFTPS